MLTTVSDQPVFATLFSGSAGNSQYLGTKDSGVLIDIGRSCRQMEQQLAKLGVKPEAVKAILLTHEHGDHSKGLKVWEKKHPTPLYASGGTLGALDEADVLTGDYPVYQVYAEPFEAGGYTVTAFPTSHDCAEGTGYRLDLPDGVSVSVIPDTGIILPEIRETVTGSDLVYCENDYNTDLLWCGPYPYKLKTRIDSDEGHLSTAQVGKFARILVHDETHPVKRIVLGHLSEHNNDPEMAVRLVSMAVQGAVPVNVAAKQDPKLFALDELNEQPESAESERGEMTHDVKPGTDAEPGCEDQPEPEGVAGEAGRTAEDHDQRSAAGSCGRVPAPESAAAG